MCRSLLGERPLQPDAPRQQTDEVSPRLTGTASSRLKIWFGSIASALGIAVGVTALALHEVDGQTAFAALITLAIGLAFLREGIRQRPKLELGSRQDP